MDHGNCRDHTQVIMEIYDPKNLDHTKFRDHTHQIIPVVGVILIGSRVSDHGSRDTLSGDHGIKIYALSQIIGSSGIPFPGSYDHSSIFTHICRITERSWNQKRITGFFDGVLYFTI